MTPSCRDDSSSKTPWVPEHFRNDALSPKHSSTADRERKVGLGQETIDQSERFTYQTEFVALLQIGRSRTRCRSESTVTRAPASRCGAAVRIARRTRSPMATGRTSCARDLNDARFVGPQSRQQSTEIQVVGENDPAVGRSEIEDLGIRRLWPTDCRPVDCIDTLAGQEGHPQRAEVHIDQQFHAAGNGSSISSTRQAAYASACRMSSSSRYG